MSERRTDDATLIEALRLLAHTITTGNGVIEACLAEAAARLETLVVVRPGTWKIVNDPHTTQTWQPFVDDILSKRDAEWLAALVTAGVPVKEPLPPGPEGPNG